MAAATTTTRREGPFIVRRIGAIIAALLLLGLGFTHPASAVQSTNVGSAVCDNDGDPETPPVPATIVGSGLIRGTAGADVIVGSPGPDTILGRGGDDVVCGMGGGDNMQGGPG